MFIIVYICIPLMHISVGDEYSETPYELTTATDTLASLQW